MFPDLSKIGEQAAAVNARVIAIENNVGSLLTLFMQVATMVQQIHTKVHEVAPVEPNGAAAVVSAVAEGAQVLEAATQVMAQAATVFGLPGVAGGEAARPAINVPEGETPQPTHG